ncbi:MAG TPA: DUF2232 domain-containing protein [Hyphomicrobiales bacterium]|nr:DUF2232 domain-containing protein [Hyphomicrobiales bacterium]
MSLVLVGIAAISGLASAALMLALGAGSTVAVVLFLFSPLPLLVAGLGWGHRAAGIGALVGTAALGAAAGWAGARGYVLAAGLPGWWLSFVALHGRPHRDDPAAKDWAGPGQLVLWAAALGALLVIATIPFIGTTLDAYRGALGQGLENFLRAETGTPAAAPLVLPGGENVADFVDFFAVLLPPFGAASWMLVLLLDLWIAARLARASGQLARPWPAIPALRLPIYALPALVIAAGLSFAPGLASVAGQVVAAVLVVALAIVGLAVIHAGTRGSRGRVLVLIGVYLMLFVQAWTGLLLALLGLVEQTIGLRRRLAPPGGPQRRP